MLHEGTSQLDDDDCSITDAGLLHSGAHWQGGGREGGCCLYAVSMFVLRLFHVCVVERVCDRVIDCGCFIESTSVGRGHVYACASLSAFERNERRRSRRVLEECVSE